jgi:AcrR family transcriptional regulator
MDTKHQILLGTIAVIERKGLQKATSRDIAAESGVNVAAINYHFGTKKALVEQAMLLTLHNGMAGFERILNAPGESFRTRLRNFYAAVLYGGTMYPNITRAHLYDSIIEGAAPGPYLVALNDLLQKALDKVGPQDTILDRDDLARAIETGLNSALMRCLNKDLFSLTPSGASGVEAEARRLVRLVPE